MATQRRLMMIGTTLLVVAMEFFLSCKREERTLRVSPAAAEIGGIPSLTPVRASGATQPIDQPRLSALPPHGFDASAYALSEGGRLYEAMNCSGCHAHGGGGIGPPLMDAQWIYGWEPEVVFASIVEGRPNGMPSFGGRLNDHQVWQLVAYVRSLSGQGSSRQAAPGRSDHMSGPPPPNSIERARPRTSSVDLEELRRREQLEFARWGWVDADSQRIRIPDAIVDEVARQSKKRPATTTTTNGARPSTIGESGGQGR